VQEIALRSFITTTLLHILSKQKDEMDGKCSMHGRNGYKILAGKSEGKRYLRGFRLRWEDTIKWI
jgi:hypothetical protein